MIKLAPYSVDLIKELDKRFPHKCPPLEATDREIWYYAGQRNLIDLLLLKLKEHEENILRE